MVRLRAGAKLRACLQAAKVVASILIALLLASFGNATGLYLQIRGWALPTLRIYYSTDLPAGMTHFDQNLEGLSNLRGSRQS